jgi:thiol-disulfide isomerase/thioredoxin
MLLIPGIVFVLGAQAAPQVDAKAMALLAKVEATMKATKALSADWEEILRWPARENRLARTDTSKGKLQALKPGFQRFDTEAVTMEAGKEPSKPFLTTWAHDGKNRWLVMSETYSKDTRPNGITFAPFDDFYSLKNSYLSKVTASQKDKSLKKLEYLGQETFEGASYKVVRYKHSTENPIHYGGDIKLYIGADGLVHRVINEVEYEESKWQQESVLRNIVLNPSFTPQQFAYTPPVGYKERKNEEQKRPPLLKVGTNAPEFTALTSDGKPVKLSDYRGKVVVLDFWATWCGPCMMAMPGTNKVAQQLKDKNVVVLGVNVWDEKEKFDAWLPEKGKAFGAIVFLRDPTPRNETANSIASKLYNVSGIPTQYVIDARGVIRASFVGADETTKPLEDAIKKASK